MEVEIKVGVGAIVIDDGGDGCGGGEELEREGREYWGGGEKEN